jgi:hypothetical protein
MCSRALLVLFNNDIVLFERWITPVELTLAKLWEINKSHFWSRKKKKTSWKKPSKVIHFSITNTTSNFALLTINITTHHSFTLYVLYLIITIITPSTIFFFFSFFFFFSNFKSPSQSPHNSSLFLYIQQNLFYSLHRCYPSSVSSVCSFFQNCIFFFWKKGKKSLILFNLFKMELYFKLITALRSYTLYILVNHTTQLVTPFLGYYFPFRIFIFPSLLRFRFSFILDNIHWTYPSILILSHFPLYSVFPIF